MQQIMEDKAQPRKILSRVGELFARGPAYGFGFEEVKFLNGCCHSSFAIEGIGFDSEHLGVAGYSDRDSRKLVRKRHQQLDFLLLD